MPIGRQFASGLSLLFVAIRAFFRSAAHGVKGSPPGIFAPRSKKVARGGALGSGGNGADRGSTTTAPVAPAPRATTPATSCGRGSRSPLTQLPERSGLPFAVRGGRASSCTRPCASRGTPGAAYFGHCASNVMEHAIRRTTDAIRIFMVVGSLLSLAGVRKKLLTGAGQCHESRVGVIASVFRTAAFDGNNVADLQGILAPPRTHQSIGAAQFDSPVADLAGVIRHIH